MSSLVIRIGLRTHQPPEFFSRISRQSSSLRFLHHHTSSQRPPFQSPPSIITARRSSRLALAPSIIYWPTPTQRPRARTSKHLAERIGILGKAPDQAAGREPGSCWQSVVSTDFCPTPSTRPPPPLPTSRQHSHPRSPSPLAPTRRACGPAPSSKGPGSWARSLTRRPVASLSVVFDCELTAPGESFCEEATSVVVAFKDGHRDADSAERDADSVPEYPHRLRMSFKAAYNLPIVTFRFHVNVFGHDDSGKKEKTTLYFDVPPHHISSIEHTHHVDTAELAQEDLQHFSGGLTRVRFLLKRPGNLVQPVRDLALKPGSQRIFDGLTSLAAALDFELFMPHTTLSKEQLRRLEQAVASPISRHDLQEQHKERDWWLGALYGGVGGRLFNPADDSTDSECESTIATATPPAYRRAADAVDDAAADADSPPPYDQLESEAADPADIKGKQRGKRLRDSPDPDVRLHRRRMCSPLAGACVEKIEGSSLEKLESNPVALVLSKLEQVLKENKSLRAELLAMRHRQDQLEDMIRRGAKESAMHHLEADAADLDTRVSSLEERQAELEDRQGKTEDKCDTIEVEIADQVHSALRERLIGALETM